MDRTPLIIDMSKQPESLMLLSHAPVLSSQRIGWNGMLFQEYHHPGHEVPEYVMLQHLILIRITPGLTQESRIDGRLYHRKLGDDGILIVPAGVSNATVWTGEAEFLRLTISPQFLSETAHESIDPDRVEPIPQFAIHDPLIQQIGLSLKADLEAGSPTGRIFGESAATMLAARLLQQHSVRTPKLASDEDGLSSYTLRQVLDYIRSHLSQDLSIADIAQVSGMSPYYFMRMFKKSMHVTFHQYVIQMRIDRAKELSKLARRLRRSLISHLSVGLPARVILLTYFVNRSGSLPEPTSDLFNQCQSID